MDRMRSARMAALCLCLVAAMGFGNAEAGPSERCTTRVNIPARGSLPGLGTIVYASGTGYCTGGWTMLEVCLNAPGLNPWNPSHKSCDYDTDTESSTATATAWAWPCLPGWEYMSDATAIGREAAAFDIVGPVVVCPLPDWTDEAP